MEPSQLKRFSLFKDVDESKLNKIAPYTMLVEFPEGKTIIQEGGYCVDWLGRLLQAFLGGWGDAR